MENARLGCIDVRFPLPPLLTMIFFYDQKWASGLAIGIPFFSDTGLF